VLHLQILSPVELTATVLDTLADAEGVGNVVLIRNAAIRPLGDVVQCEVARMSATLLFERLRALGLDRAGALTVVEAEWVEVDGGADAMTDADAIPIEADAIVWEQLAKRTHDDARLSRSYAILMALAGILACLAILTNNVILVVGAMIVSPDFGPTAGLAVAIITRRSNAAGESLAALLVGFALAAGAAFVVAWTTVVLGIVPQSYELGAGSLSDLVEGVNGVAFVAAFVAGMAGAISLGSAKSGAVVGVAVSITTIPAAANIGVTLAFGEFDSALSSLALLLLNVFGLVSAELLTFMGSRRVARRARRRAAVS
jgi:uncharacterized hydrophobic protein (TIGR00271 family)